LGIISATQLKIKTLLPDSLDLINTKELVLCCRNSTGYVYIKSYGGSNNFLCREGHKH